MEFSVILLKEDNKDAPVVIFLEALLAKNRELYEKTIARIKKLSDRRFHRSPFSKPLGDGLFEVKTESKTDTTRIFYCFGKGRKIYILHGMVKKDKRRQSKEIEIARKIKNRNSL